MNILTIPLRTLRRKGLRTALMVLVFAVGVASVVALGYLSRTVGASLEHKLSAFGANILVAPRTETLSVGYGGLNLGDVSYDIKYLDVSDAETAIREIDLGERISAVAPKFAILTTLSGTPAGVIGVAFEEELLIKSHWAVDGAVPESPDQALAGSALAERLEISPGDVVTVEGTALTVSGVLQPTGGEDDNVLFADIHTLQRVTGKPGRAHFIEVAALCAGCPIEDIVAQIEAALPHAEVKAMRQVVKQRMTAIGFVQHLAWAAGLIILLTACGMVGLSVFSAVNERKKEIGLLRAVGFSRLAVFSVFSLEAFFVGFLSGPLGYVAGFLAGQKSLVLMGMTEGPALSFNPLYLAGCAGAVAALAVLASALPAYKASMVEPSRALVML